MSTEQTITATRTELASAFKTWVDRVDPEQDYTPEEWAAFTPEQRSEKSADYLIKLLEEIQSC